MTTASTKTIARIAARLAAGAILLFAAVNTANAAGCPEWMCGANGTQLDGIHPETLQPPTIDASQPVSGKVRSQAEKRLEQQRKDLIRNWGG